MKLKVGFKGLNIVQDLTALNTALKFCQHSEAVVQRCSQKFHKSRRKHLCQNLIFNKVAGLRPEKSLLKRRLWHRRFPANFVKFQRSPFFIEHLRWLLLNTKKNDEISENFEKNFRKCVLHQDICRCNKKCLKTFCFI